jgi:CelD/BcsL family acetyltransferase involved in cellulose biosynthesis
MNSDLDEVTMLLESAAKISVTSSALVTETFQGGIEIIGLLADEWRALCDEGPCAPPFFRPDFIASHMRAFAANETLVLLTVRVAGRLRAVLPLVAERGVLHGVPVRKLRSASNVHSARFDLIHGEIECEAVTQAIWQMLRQRSDWDVVELTEIAQGSKCESLLSLAVADNHPVGVWELPPGPYLTLDTTCNPLQRQMETPLADVNAKFLSSLRRKRRKLEEKGTVRFFCLDEATPEDLKRFYELESAGWKGQGGTAILSDANVRRFYDDLAHATAQFGSFALYIMECAGRAIAMQYCLLDHERCYLLKPAYDENFSAYSPGHLLVHEVLHDGVARGLNEYDFMSPQSEWKSRWAKTTRTQSHGYIFRDDLRGRALHAWKFHLLKTARRIKRRWVE